MPALSTDQRTRILNDGKNVFHSYLCLHTLKKQVLPAIKSTNEGDTFELTITGRSNSESATIRFTRMVNDDGSETLTVTEPQASELPDIKGITDYSGQELARIIASHSPVSYYPREEAFSVRCNDGPVIGGRDKIDLYELHISNLGYILENIAKPDFNDNMLVSLTTGSGKTFTQALWMLVLALSGQRATFAVPANLLEQFKLDLMRLLPTSFLDDHPQIRVTSVVDALNTPNIDNQDFFSFDEAHLIADQEDLFLKARGIAGQKTTMFLTATPTPALTSLASGNDGQTRLATVASMSNSQKVAGGYAERVQSTAKSAKSIEEIHGQSDRNRLMADLFDRQTGFDASLPFAEAYLYHTNLRTIPELTNADEDGPQDKLRRVVRWALQPSAFQGKTLICANHFEDVVNLDLLTRQFEAGIQAHPGFNQRFYANGNIFDRKNTYQFLQISGVTPDESAYTEYAQSCYSQFSEALLENIRRINTDAGCHCADTDLKALRDEILAGLKRAPIENSKHAIIDLALSILASKAANGSDNLTDILQNFGGRYLDERRKTDLSAFYEELSEQTSKLNADYLRSLLLYNADTNPRGLTPSQTEELIPLLQQVNTVLGYGPVLGKRVTDNWYADAELFTFFDEHEAFNEFAQKHYKKYAFNQVEKNETIEPGQVFNGFSEYTHGIGISNAGKAYGCDLHLIPEFPENTEKLIRYRQSYVYSESNARLYYVDSKGQGEPVTLDKPQELQPVIAGMKQRRETKISLSPEQISTLITKNGGHTQEAYTPKIRTKRAVEALNPRAQETVFTPVCTEEDTLANADNLFRMGITSLYCTDTKIAGFNDPNLHQVAVLAHSQENPLANPANIIQAYGRNRGLNPHKTPNFFLVTQKGVQCLFGDEELNKDDYQADYHEALRRFKPVYLDKLAQELADNILLWIESHRDALHEVDEEKLSDAVISYLFNTLDAINKTNAYQFKLSVKDFYGVLEKAIDTLNGKKQELDKGTHLPLLARVVAWLAFWAAKILQSIAARESREEVQQRLDSLQSESSEDDEIAAAMWDSESKRAEFYHKVLGIPFETINEHDNAQKLFSMSMFNEANGLVEIRDKYYSLALKNPRAFIDKVSRAHLNENLTTLMEGLCSYIALSKTEHKESIFSALQVFRIDSTDENRQEILNRILSLELNPDHPDRAHHLQKIQKMLTRLGIAQPSSPNVEAVEALVKSQQVDIVSGYMTHLAENRVDLEKLNITSSSLQGVAEKIRSEAAKDIQSLIHPFLTHTAYKNMLEFVHSQFSETELQTALGTTAEDGIAASLRTFIADTLNPPEDYYLKYCLPSVDAMLNNENALNARSLESLPFAANLQHLQNFYQVLRESHLRFYNMSEAGEIAHATSESAPFFTSRNANPVLRGVACGYNIALCNSLQNKNTPMTLYLQRRGATAIFNVKQVKADGTEISRNGVNLNFDSTEMNDELRRPANGKTYIHLKPQYLQALNEHLTNANNNFDSLLNPSVRDENTAEGKAWRNLLGLHGLKQALPVFDSTQKLVRTREIDKALDVSKSVLKGILNKELPHSSNPLVARGKMFNEVLSQERRQGSAPSEALLKGKSSRIEKMQAQYDLLKTGYHEHVINANRCARFILQLRNYIESRGESALPNNKPKAKPSLFFNEGLTTKKVRMAQRLIDKLGETSRFADCLAIIEDALKEHAHIMRANHKNPNSSSMLGDILNRIHQSLLEEQIPYRTLPNNGQ